MFIIYDILILLHKCMIQLVTKLLLWYTYYKWPFTLVYFIKNVKFY